MEDPNGLYKALAETEVLSYLPAKYAAKADKLRSEADVKLKRAKAESFAKATGPVTERNLKTEAEIAEIQAEVDKYEREVKFWRSISQSIQTRISLGQSILNIMSNEIKAGLRT